MYGCQGAEASREIPPYMRPQALARAIRRGKSWLKVQVFLRARRSRRGCSCSSSNEMNITPMYSQTSPLRAIGSRPATRGASKNTQRASFARGDDRDVTRAHGAADIFSTLESHILIGRDNSSRAFACFFYSNQSRHHHNAQIFVCF